MPMLDNEHSGVFLQRHFSTEEKTRRLRSMRMSAPLPIRLGDAYQADGNQDLVAQPLRLEELMAFLREGNSMREL